MLLKELLEKDYSPEQIAKILYSFSEYKDLDLQKFITDTKLINRTFLRILVNGHDNYNYYNLLTDNHQAYNQILFPTGEYKTVSNSSRIVRTATANENDASMVSTTFNNTREDSHITLNNRIILPGDEVYLTIRDFSLNGNLSPKQSSILLRNIQTSSINTISNSIHQNSYKQFNDEELQFAKKYFSFDNGNIIPSPSFQFSFQQGKEIFTNSIHLDKLIEYVYDFGNEYTKYNTYKSCNRNPEFPPILKYNLGMPFRDIAIKNIVVDQHLISTFVKSMQNKATTDCMDDLMKEEIPNPKIKSSGIHSLYIIYQALITFRNYINKNPDDIKTLMNMTQCINTLVNTSLTPSPALQKIDIKEF